MTGKWAERVRGLPYAVIDPAACLRRVAHFGVDDGAADPARPDLGPGLARRHGLFAQADLDDVELLAARVGAPCVGNHLLADLELEIEIGALIARVADYGVEAATLGQPRSRLAKTR